MCEQSLRKVGQGILELLIGNEKVTDGQTDRPTDMCKAISPLFFEGGHKNMLVARMSLRLYVSFHVYFNSTLLHFT